MLNLLPTAVDVQYLYHGSGNKREQFILCFPKKFPHTENQHSKKKEKNWGKINKYTKDKNWKGN